MGKFPKTYPITFIIGSSPVLRGGWQIMNDSNFFVGWIEWSIMGGAALFLLGNLWSDFRNENSWIKGVWNNSRRLADVVDKPVSQDVKINGKDYFHSLINLVFVKDSPRTTILLHCYMGMSPDGKYQSRKTLRLVENEDFHQGEDKSLKITTMTDTAGLYSSFGDTLNIDYRIFENSRNIACIEIKSKKGKQKHYMHILHLWTGNVAMTFLNTGQIVNNPPTILTSKE